MGILTSILVLLAGVGVFIAGMNMMGQGLESSAGSSMKKLFNKISNNRLAGVGVGVAVTAIIQSSSATSVMVIGFVNAGVMTLVQATAIIMGANIGTTVTGIIVSLKSLPIGEFAAAMAFVGVMMTFFKKDKIKKIGGILCGLGLIFVGLDLMSGAFKDSQELTEMFANMFAAIDFPLLLILLGAVFTAIIQSSSAATGLIIIMAGSGAVDVQSAFFIVLGTNIGTCATAVWAALGTNTNAKRTAFIHLMVKTAGTVILGALYWIFAPHVVGFFQSIFPNTPEMQIAWFHVAFNVCNTLLQLPFVKQIVKIATVAIKDKPSPAESQYNMRFIDDRLLSTPPIAVAQVKKEIIYMAEVARENIRLSMSSLTSDEYVNREKIADNEARINHTYHSIARYLIKLASLNLSVSDEKLVGAYHHVITDIERIGDYSENFIEQTEKMKAEKISFSDIAIAEIVQMYNKVDNMFDLSLHVFEHRDFDSLDKVAQIEDEVDDMKADLGVSHIARLHSGNCDVERGTYFFSVITALERIGDHLINIAFSIKNPTGSQSKRTEINDMPNVNA